MESAGPLLPSGMPLAGLPPLFPSQIPDRDVPPAGMPGADEADGEYGSDGDDEGGDF